VTFCAYRVLPANRGRYASHDARDVTVKSECRAATRDAHANVRTICTCRTKLSVIPAIWPIFIFVGKVPYRPPFPRPYCRVRSSATEVRYREPSPLSRRVRRPGFAEPPAGSEGVKPSLSREPVSGFEPLACHLRRDGGLEGCTERVIVRHFYPCLVSPASGRPSRPERR
jgi:hypothetical protein